MKKTIALFLLLSSFVCSSFAQEKFQRNSFYLEAFGSGLFGSLNYERQLTSKPGIGLRIGVGFYTEKAFYLTLPVGLNYLFPLKRENTFMEAGFTVSPTFRDGNFKSKADDKWTNFVPSIGYRIHTNKKWLWRFALTPVINRFSVTPSGGVSFGKLF